MVGKSYTTFDKLFQHKLAHKVRLPRLSFSRDLKVSTQKNFEKSLSPWKSVLTSGPLAI